MTPDLSEARHIHLVGAGGAGMGAIANVLYRMGHTVTGSDLKDGPVVERLRVAGMEIHVGHDAANVGAADLVAISTAIPEHNPEVRAANERQIPLLRRSRCSGSGHHCSTWRRLPPQRPPWQRFHLGSGSMGKNCYFFLY